MNNNNLINAFLIFSLLLLSSCSTIEKAGINMISNAMAGEGSGELFTGDNDPELVKDALPFILKMYEMLAEKDPENAELRLATGSTFIMYSNIFIQTPAGMLPDEEFMDQHYMINRSKKMYRRGTEYVLDALELRHKGFRDKMEQGLIDDALSDMEKDDVASLYWAASGLMGEFSCDPFDFNLGPGIYKPVALIYKALELDETFNNGAIHDLLIAINSSLPVELMYKQGTGGKSQTAIFTDKYYGSMQLDTSFDKARYHFARSVDISGGLSASPYISLASSVSVNEQNIVEYEELLNAALEIDPESFPEMRLAAIIYREKAQWLLDNKSNYFLLDFNEGDFE
jgi:predicted anti-sigma-YlaC factor YlaD